MRQRCECEHIDHFEGRAHGYGHAFRGLFRVSTMWGRFNVCRVCADTHLKEAS